MEYDVDLLLNILNSYYEDHKFFSSELIVQEPLEVQYAYKLIQELNHYEHL